MVSMTASPLAAPGADGRGQGLRVAELSRALADRGHEVVVHTRRDRLELPTQVQLDPGVTVHHVNAGPLRSLAADDVVPFMQAFASELAQRWLIQPPEVAHAHFWDSGLASAQAAAVARIPVALALHSPADLEPSEPSQSAAGSSPRPDVERSLALSTSNVIATSRAEVQALLRMGTPQDRLAVLPDGVDTTLFSPRGPEAARGARHHRLLSLGELRPGGGVDEAIRVIAQVPVAELVVVSGPGANGHGMDQDVARLTLLAQELGVADRVRLLGAVPREDRPALIRSADLVVCLPRQELSARVALEAMACGRPIVATAVGALTDVVDDGVTGLLVPPQSASAAALAVRQLLSAPGLRVAMGEQARTRAQDTFDWRHVAQAAEQVYLTMRARTHAASRPLPSLRHPAPPRDVARADATGVPAPRTRSSSRGRRA